MGELREPGDVPGTLPAPVAVGLHDPLARADVTRLCDELHTRLVGTPTPVVLCDVAGVARPDVTTVDAVARLQLTARRAGSRVVLQGAGPELRGLLALVGLSRVVPALEPDSAPGARAAPPAPPPTGSGFEVVGQPEVREELGAHEVRDPDDPAALDP